MVNGHDGEGTAFQILVEPFQSPDNAETILFNLRVILFRFGDSSGGRCDRALFAIIHDVGDENVSLGRFGIVDSVIVGQRTYEV